MLFRSLPTLRRVEALLGEPLFEGREGEGAVGPRAEDLVADGLAAHQGRRGGEHVLVFARRFLRGL